MSKECQHILWKLHAETENVQKAVTKLLLGRGGNDFILEGLQLTPKENTTAYLKLFKFRIRLLCRSAAFVSGRDTGHPHDGWFRWVSICY